MNTIKPAIFVLCALLFSASAFADRAADEAAIRKSLGDAAPDSIAPTPVAGIYEVLIGPHVVYISADGKYLFQGELVDLQTRTSLTEPRRREAQRAALAKVSEDQMIVFKPEQVKHTVTVFTDIDCGYCRKLHGELDQYLAEGIKVRYLMYPRAGANSESYRKAVAVWCAKDRNDALTRAKAGEAIDMKTCDNPVDEHMEVAAALGLRGTPLIVLEDGGMQPGYVPAKQLSRLLNQHVATVK